MSIFYVRKNGSGTHTTIQSAIYDSVNGDTIDIGPGTFDENIELNKAVILKGAGKDITIVQGKMSSDVFTGCSWYAGESVINTTSTSGMIRGRLLSGTNLGAGSRVSSIVSPTQFQVSVPTAVTGTITKTGQTWTSGASTITLNTATSVVVGMKVESSGSNAVLATVTAYNTTTRAVTLSAPTTASGSNATLVFKPLRSSVSITQIAQFSGSTFPATIQAMNIAMNGWQLKDMTINGFDGSTPTEAAALSITSPSSGYHQNWLIDNCKFVAMGDQAIATSSNLRSSGGTIQNCEFDGTTFTGSEPAEVPAFSAFTLNGCQVLTANSVSVPSTLGIVAGTASVGSTFNQINGSAFSGYVTAMSGNMLTLSVSLTQSIGSTISMSFNNVQFKVPNCARQLVVIGNAGSVTECTNTTFKNNVIKGRTGAVISSNGNLNMFNNAVSIDTVGGLIEDNFFDGNYGAGANTLVSNFALRSRGAGVVVQNNVNRITNGRTNSGFYIPNGTSINNVDVNKIMVNPSQVNSGDPIAVEIEKTDIKSISKVASDPVFSDEANWALVVCVYKHKDSSKRLVSAFKDVSAQRQMKLRPNMQAGEEYQLHKMIITKADRSMLVLKRSEISNASSYDFILK
jgi:hypothetical protein